MVFISSDRLVAGIEAILRGLSNADYLSCDDEIRIYGNRDRVHWDLAGIVQHVTWRLNDSLPQEKINMLKELIRGFRKENPLPWDYKTAKRYREIVGRQQEKLLDRGYGSCVLRYSNIRKELESVLHSLSEDKADILAYVIMPNHVHILLRPLIDLCDVIKLIKGESALRINRVMRRSGEVWVDSYFDRMMRHSGHLETALRYIVRNPRFIRLGDYTLWVKGIGEFCWSEGLLAAMER